MKNKVFKYTFLINLVVLILFSCNVTKQPVYKELQDFGVRRATLNEVLIKGNILFYNPNDVGVKVETEDLDLQ